MASIFRSVSNKIPAFTHQTAFRCCLKCPPWSKILPVDHSHTADFMWCTVHRRAHANGCPVPRFKFPLPSPSRGFRTSVPLPTSQPFDHSFRLGLHTTLPSGTATDPRLHPAVLSPVPIRWRIDCVLVRQVWGPALLR
ncbi:uncharacterized protein CC84DRAFT_446457 [Paraphaeosphaeria sporulosa]|uniref:Uncharacterized protein n=1 Tax=Paraphaeosphaeria sporulosa TaxID=1460663 RepID=A0A177CR04_9PLEO|nr:uncharacterized protein CC84DRAFT_446457 [Paraphaeosphaeria sporulosa]OAG09651.1 hypothetical protein CC84DRAFT_446457 [Paraphaeosphaeria sporulosa]